MTSANESDQYREYAVVVDTNILMAQPHIEGIDWGVEPITVYLLESVVYDELEGLRRAQNGSVAQRATEAYDHLTHLHTQMNEDGYQVPRGWLKIVAAPD